MKQSFTLFAILVIVLAIPQNVKAYSFSATVSSGQTLFFLLENNDSEVSVVNPGSSSYNNPYYGYTVPSGDLLIPDSITYLGQVFPIKKIHSAAFYNCQITSVVISNGITTIEGNAFESCNQLKRVVIPNSVTVIRAHAFKDCTNLRSVTIGTGLTSVNYYNEYYSYCSFSGCSNIKYLEYNCPANVLGAFPSGALSNLDTLIIGNNTQPEYNTGAAPLYLNYNCTHNLSSNIYKNRLEKVVVGNNVNTIYDDEFNGASNLRIITIGNRVSSIGERAFRLCSSLDTIYALRTTAPSLGANAFQLTPTTKVVVTPCNAEYENSWGTTNFTYLVNGLILTLQSDDTLRGQAYFVQPVNCITQTAIIQATPNENYAFDRWSDGNTDNPRTIVLTENTTLSAQFTQTHVSVNTHSSNEIKGYTLGHGTYQIGSTVTLSAIANYGFRFTSWNDSITDNPRIIVADKDTVLIANFESNIDTLLIHDTTYIDVPYAVHDTTYIDVPYAVHDTTYINVHDTTTVIDTVTNYIYDTTIVHDTTLVTDTLWLTQYDTIWLHDTIIIHDTLVVGADEVDALNAKIYTSHGQIVVEGTEDNTVWLYDINGRILATKQDEYSALRFDVPASGTYLIKVGHHPARRVVVIK